MNAKLGATGWGVGGRAHMAADGRGAGGGDVSAGGQVAADDLAAMGAADAVATLAVDGAADKMPEAAPFYFPGPVAEAYFWDDERVVGIQGPFGSGKTTTKMMRKMRRAANMPRSVVDGRRRYRVLFTRETYRQLWSSVIPSYLKVFPKAFGQWSGGRGDPVRHYIEFEDGKGVIEFEAIFMAFGDSVEQTLRGIEVTDLDISEADTNPIDTLTFGVGRIGRYPESKHFEGYPPQYRGIGQIDCDFNAPEEDNWTVAVFHDEGERKRLTDLLSADLPPGTRPLKFSFYRQPGYGEPGVENLTKLPPGYYETQIALNRLAGRSDVTERMVFNRISNKRMGDPVFLREFRRRIHVNETTITPEPGVPLMLGLDQGFKGAAVIAQFLDPFHWRILAELHFPQERLFAAEFGRRLRNLLDTRFPGHRIEGGWGDVAGESGAAQAEENATWNRAVAKSAEFPIRPQRIGANRLQPRLEAVRAALEFMHGGEPGLLIDPSCKFIIRGFEARYVWTDQIDGSGDKRKVPDKRLTEANVIDALQYLLLSKSRGDGMSPISFPAGKSALLGQNGRPQMAPEPAGGLSTGYDITNPYGG